MSPKARSGSRWQEVVRFGDLLLRAADREPGAEALVIGEERLTYAQLQEGAMRIAQALVASGIGPGKRVGILMPNCATYVELLFGISLTGAVVVPINSRFAPRELRHVIENGDLDLVFTSDLVVSHADYVARLHEAFPALDASAPGRRSSPAAGPCPVVLYGSRSVAGMDSGVEFESRHSAVEEAAVLDLHRRTPVRSVAMMMYTSGTTSSPKGCMLSHEALVRPGTVAGRTKFEIRSGEGFWDPLPMFHMSVILPLVATMDAGGTLLSMVHFEVEEALRMIAAEQPAIVYSVFPAVTQALLGDAEYRPEDWQAVRLAVNVAPPDTLREIQARLPDHTQQISSYGLTEGGGVACYNDPADTPEQRYETCGSPLEGVEVEIRGIESGLRLGPGERGEIVLRGYGLFSGYYGDPEGTAAVLDADGWLRTGDIGIVDSDGRVAYAGRTKDMLKVGGENVAAMEIESHIAALEAVKLVAVVGVPDPFYIEVPAAFVELRPGHELSEEELLEHCRQGLAKFKVPRHFRFVEEWPMSATKIQKFLLAEELTAELSRARQG